MIHMRAALLILSLTMLIGCRNNERDDLNLQLAKEIVTADLAYCSLTGLVHAKSEDVLVAEGILKRKTLYKCKDGTMREYIWLGEYANEANSQLILFFSPELSNDEKYLVARLGGKVEYVNKQLAEEHIALCREYLERLKNPKPNSSIPVPDLYTHAQTPK